MIVAQKTIRNHRQATAIDVAPVIRRLQAAIDGIVQAELKRFRAKLHTLSLDQHQALRVALSELAIKILDPLTRSLEQAAYNGDSEKVASIWALFSLAPLFLVQAREDEPISLAMDQLNLLVA